MTDRRLGTADLALLEALFDDLTDTTFCVKNSELRYAAANQAMARFCGARRPADILGRTSSDFFPEPLAKRYAVLDRQTLVAGVHISNKIDFIPSEPRSLGWLISNRTPVRDEAGDIVGIVLIGRWIANATLSDDAVLARLSRVVEQISDRLMDPLNLAALARLAGVSRSQLERDFRRVFSMPPRSFQRKTRIERAMTMLEGGGRIGDVAHACGFSDHSAFTRAFREVTGLTPRGYRATLH